MDEYPSKLAGPATPPECYCPKHESRVELLREALLPRLEAFTIGFWPRKVCSTCLRPSDLNN